MLNRFVKSLVRTSTHRQRVADQRRRELSRRNKRLCSFESLETRRLLAADVEIGALDNNSSYSRSVAGGIVTYTPIIAGSQIGASLIGLDLSNGLDVVVLTATAAAAQPGDITVTDLIQQSGIGVPTLTLRADRDIVVTSGIEGGTIGIGDLNVVLNADRDAAGGGRVEIAAPGGITTQTGNITIGGGLDPTTTPAIGRTGIPSGVMIQGTTLQTVSGNVLVNGRGADGNDSNADGVFISTGQPENIVTDSGSITINGIAGSSTAADSNGVRFSNAAAIVTNTGVINITGLAGGSSTSNDGVEFRGGSRVSSFGQLAVGAVNISGTTNNTSSSVSDGLFIQNSSVDVNAAAISLIGLSTSPAGGNDNDGIHFDNATITSSATVVFAPTVGVITINGQSNNPIGANANGVLIDNATNIRANDAAINILGTATGSATSSLNEGIQITVNSVVETIESNIAGPISVTGTGGGISGNGVSLTSLARLGGLRSPVDAQGTNLNANASGVFVAVGTVIQGSVLDLNGISQSTDGTGVTITGSVNADNVSVIGTSAAGVSTNVAGFGIDLGGTVNSAGPATLSAVGRDFRLTNAGVFTQNALTLEAVDDPSGINNIDITNSSLTSTAGDVVFNVGDRLSIDSTTLITAVNVTANVDRSIIDPDTNQGGAALVQAAFTITGNIRLSGGVDADQFAVIPNVTSNVDGGGVPGVLDFINLNALNQDVNVTTNQLSIPSISAVVNFVNLELINASNVNNGNVSGDNANNAMVLRGSALFTSVDNSVIQVVFDPIPTGTVTINGLNGDDRLLIDLTPGAPRGAINFNGGNNASPNLGDQLSIAGTPPVAINSIDFNYINNNNGSIVIDGTSTINYLGLEPITSSVDAADVTLNFDTIGETISVTQVGNTITVDSSNGEVTSFVAPTAHLTMNTGGGTDIVTVDGLNATLTGAFVIDDPDLPKDDTVSFNNTKSNIITGSIDLSVLNVDVNANLNADGGIIFGRGSNTGLIRTNNAAITSLGDIAWDELVNLLGTTTVTTDNDSLVSFRFPVEGPQGLTVTGGSRVEFKQPVGSVTPLASVTATATAGLIRLDDVTTTGAQLYNSPVVTDGGGGTVSVIGGSVSFASTIDNASVPADDFVINASTSLSLSGRIGVGNAFNIVDITSSSGLSLNQNIVATNNIVLSTIDRSAVGQDIVINGTAQLTAPTSITINAGDDVNFAATTTINTASLMINADTVPANPDPGVGSNVTVLGTITASVGTIVTTGADPDLFSIRPQAGTAFTLTASDPATTPGDRFDINASGGNVTIDVATNAIILPGVQPITTSGIENLNLSNVGTLTVTGTNLFDRIVVSKNPNVAGGDLITINGGTPIAISSVTSLVINGLGGDDFFGYDATVNAISVPVTFNGGQQDNTTGGDFLRIDGSFTTQVLNYTAKGIDGNNGSLVLDGATVTYTGLEPITAGNSVDTILNFSTGVVNNATLRDNASVNLIEIIDNGSTFEDTQLPNPTNSLTVNLGAAGDTLNVGALDPAYAASLVINGGAGVDNVQVNGVTISNTPGRGLDVTGVETLGITGSTFNNNTADVGGGLRVIGGVTTINSSTFSNNDATGPAANQGGGGIFIAGGSMNIRNNSVITGNMATGLSGSGGGILVGLGGTLTVANSTISNNTASRAGGGIETRSANPLLLTNVTLTGNSALPVPLSTAPGNGGALHVTGGGNVTILGGTVINNRAAAEGGGLWNDQGTMTISGGTLIQGNFANGNLDPASVPTDLQGGGGIFNNGGTLVINAVGGAVAISSNVATGATFGSGGGILSTGGNVTITGALINQNSTVRAGGGLEIVEGTVTIINSLIDANRAATLNPITANPGNGGGLHITGAARVTIDGGSVTNNIAEAEGGGLWNSATSTLRVTGLTNTVAITGNIARGNAAPGIDGTAVQGGGGIFNNGGTLTLDGNRTAKNIDISGNAATGAVNGSGGGVLTIGGNAVLNGADISGNEAIRAGGGVEIVAGSVTILQTNISGNDVSAANLLGLGLGATAGNGGGLHITAAATVVFDGGTVNNNMAASEGGGFWNSLTGTLRIEDSQFNTVISNNIAQGNVDPTGALPTLQGGGGVFNNGGTLLFNNLSVGNTITVSANAATGANFGSGGGILSIDGNVSLAGVEINGNEAVRSGGGVEVVAGAFTMSAGQITGNDVSSANLLGLGLGASPGNGGGLHVTGAANITVTNVGITNNVAAREGGGLWNNSGTMTIQGGTLIEDNIASGPAADDGGGGVFNNGGMLIITGATTTIANNVANGTLGSGGGLFNFTGGTLSVTDAIISDNRANRAGGGIEDASGAGFGVTILRGQLIDNLAGVSPAIAAPGNGGGLHVTGTSNVLIDSASISGNIAAGEGGGLWNDRGTMTIRGTTTIDTNIARGNLDPAGVFTDLQGGGGVFNNAGTLVISNATIQNNQASGANFGSGGGVLSIGGNVTVTTTTFDSNEAVRAGGGLEIVVGTVVITGSTIIRNDVSGDNLLGAGLAASPGNGAGLHVTGAANVFVGSSIVDANIAQTEGGGLWNSFTGTMTVQNGTIVRNNVARGVAADDGGGGIFNNGGVLIITGRTTAIVNNRATGSSSSGGGIFNRNSGAVTVTDTSITGNSAGLSGGGLFADGAGTIIIDRTTFSGNRALAGTGGGIGLINTGAIGSATLRSTTINTNTAATSGGGIALRNFNFQMQNTTISTNTAGTVGGGISYDNVASSGQRTIEFSTITSNVAGTGGSNVSATGSVINVAASIFNSGTNVATPGVLVSQGNNLDSGNTSGFSQPTDLLNSNPLLGPLQNNGGPVFTHLPLFGSAAIDSGPANGLTTDARGSLRPKDGNGDGIARRDIGAAEGDLAIAVLVDDVLVNESAGNATVTVRLPNGIAGGFTVNFATANGTATQPGDYTSRTGTLAFIGTAGETRTFTIPIINDTVVESLESILISLSNPSNPMVIANDTATVRIVDNDVAALSVADVSVNENAGTATVTVQVNNAVQGGFTVNFATANGTATQPGDYTSRAGTLTFTGTAGESRTFTIPIMNDAIVEASETIRVSLSNSSNAAVNANDTATVTIADNDVAALSLADVIVNENAGTATVTVLVNNAVQGGFTVNFATANGTATQPGDYTSRTGTLTFAGTAGESRTFMIPIMNDAIVEASETIRISLSNSSNAAVNTSDTATVTITDNDAAALSIADVIVNENAGTATLTVLVNNAVQGGFTVNFATANGTATQPNDYTNSSGTLTFLGTAGESKTISIPVVSNSTAESSEQFSVALFNVVTLGANPVPASSINATDTGTVTITETVSGPSIHKLSTGTGDGDVTIDVDSFGTFGTASGSFGTRQANYNPVGSKPESSVVFRSLVAFRTALSGPYAFFDESASGLSITQAVTGSVQSATSKFTAGALRVSLTQSVMRTFDAAGARLGAELKQAFTVTNTSSAATSLDLVRYLDADLLFDGSLIDGGGVLRDRDGNLILFETDAGGTGATDTTFAGISNAGGQSPPSGQFDIDRFSTLLSRLQSSNSTLRDAVSGDLNGNGFVDAGSEYDVAIALRHLLAISPGNSVTFVTNTNFGTRPDRIAAPTTSNISGQVASDINGNGTIDAGEAVPGATVFVDTDGDRLLDVNERRTTTDSNGRYTFVGISTVNNPTARVVVQNPTSFLPLPSEIGVTRSAITTGDLSRGIAAVNVDNDSDNDLLVVNDLSNDVTVLLNDGNGGFTNSSPIQLGKRPQAISVWQPTNSSLPPVIAVAAIGTPQDHGAIYVIDGGLRSTPRELSAGNGPVSVVVNDFNGDGKADFIAAALRSGTIVGRFSGETNERVLTTARSPRSVTTGFINNDAFLDLVVVATGYQGEDSSEIIVLLGDGRGQFTAIKQSIPGSSFVDVATGDFQTNDSADEIVVAGYNGKVTIYDFINGTMVAGASVTTETGIESIAARDITGDGRIDLVIANVRAETVELFVNSTSGFVRSKTITGVASPSDIVIANLDGDNVLDVAVSNLYGRSKPNYSLPSSATVLGLTVSERDVLLTANQTSTANFGLVSSFSTPLRPLAVNERNYDADHNGSITARDALVIINAMARQSRGEGESASRSRSMKIDVNGDGKISALDALNIINYLARQNRTKRLTGEQSAVPVDEQLIQREFAVDAVMADAGQLF